MITDVSSALATLQLDPDNKQALKALAAVQPGNGSGVDREALAKALADARRWHRERSDFELCVQLIDLELAWTTDATRRADLLHEKGILLSDELLDDPAGQSCIREALEAVPGHGPSTESISRMALYQSNWQPIAARFRQQAEEATDPQLASSLFGSVAEFYLKYKADSDEGEAFLRKSLELDPKNRRSSLHLERQLSRRGRSDELLALYIKRADAASTREDRALAEVAAAELLIEMGRNADALAHYRKALEANPTEHRALRPVVDALSGTKSWAELAKVLETAARSKGGEKDVDLLVQLATLFWKQLGQVDQAESYFRRVRKLDASHRVMVDFYREYYTARNDQAQLLSVLAQAQKTEEDLERRVQMGIEMARAAEARPQGTEKAIEIWKGLLRLRPHLPEAFQALRALYTRSEKWNALLELLKDDLEAIAPSQVDERVRRYEEIVSIYRDRLNLDVMVVNTYLNILQIKPDHAGALAALAARYEAQGRWGDLIQVLTRQADAEPEARQRIAIHRRIASLWADRLGKHQNAVASLEKILDADPSDAATREKLRELYTRGRSWKQLLEVYRRELPFLAEDERRARLAEMARVASDRLNDVREAVNFWNQALEIAPRDPDALAGLAGLYERERRWAALAEILERQRLNAAGDPATELPLLERRAVLLHEKLGAGQAAVEVFRRIQSLQPTNARAVRALREIYAQLGDFAALEALFLEQGAYAELCDTLTSLADRTADVGARTRLLQRVAVLAVEKLQQPERALKAYERILATDPHNHAAASALVPLYRAAQKWPRLLATYEVLLAAGEGVSLEERRQILTDARRVCEQRLSSKALAFQWCGRAYQLEPRDPEVLADLERLAAETDEWGALAALLAKRAQESEDTDERVPLLRRLLRIAQTRVYRPQDARRYAEEILGEVGFDEEAEAALEQIFTQGKAWPELAQLLHRRVPRTGDAGERVRLLFKVAQLQEERVADLESAASTLKEVLELEPANERALRGLVRVLEARQDWAGLVEALRRDVAAKAPGDREPVLLRIGQIQETRLADAAGTFATYRQILAANPLCAPAVAGLERLAATGRADAAEIARLSLPLYEKTDNAAKQAGALEVLVGVAAAAAEKLALLERLRALYGGPLKDTRAAYRIALQIFALTPTDAPNRASLIQLAIESDTVAEVAERLREAASGTDDQELKRDLLVDVAELQEQRLGRAADAEKVYAEILKVEPLHAGAFRALSRLYRDSERWMELRTLIETRRALLLDPAEQLELLAQAAEIDESALSDADHAISCYEKMLDLDPADLRAHRALERHYAARERWRDLDELLARRATFASGTEAPELEFRRAEIRVTRFDDPDGALDLLESIVLTAPSHEGARRLLEKLLGSAPHRRRVAKILEPLYEASGAWSRLVAALEIEREGLQGPEAAAFLARIADLQENKLQARTAALATWRQVLSTDPTNPDALVEIERLATTLERTSELVDVYQELAFSREQSDIQGRADLLSRAARLYAGKLGNRRAAIDTWKLVLNLDVNNLETARPAAAALEALYAETGDMASLVKILRQQARWADDPAERRTLLFRIANLEEKSLADTDAAVATLRSILELEPENQEAIDALERIFEAGSQHRQRVDILRRRIDLAHDPAERQQLWRRVASLLERDVGDVEEAIAASVSILDENPEDLNALETLARLYEQQGRHSDRLEILERRLAIAKRDEQEVETRVGILRQIAELLAGPLGDPADALERWCEILPLAPNDATAVAALERYLEPGVDTGLRVAAAQALEGVYERSGRFADLAGIIQIYVEGQDDAHERVAQLVRLAALQETRLGDPNAAFASYALAIRDALTEERLPSLLDAYERLAGPERIGEVVALYREIAPDILDESIKLRLDRFVAEAARRMGDADLAADYYRRVLDRTPEDDSLLAALEDIYRATDDAPALYDILVRRAELARDATAEKVIRLQLGMLAEQKLDRLDDAIGAYERVLEIDPQEVEAAQAVDRLYTRTERWGDLTRFLESVLDRGMSHRDAVAVRFRLAEIEHDKQHDRERALEHLRVVLQGEPDHPGAITMLEGMLDDIALQGQAAELLEPVYAGRADWPALIKIGEIRLLQVEDPAERVAWTKRIARLYEEQLEDFESALRWYGKVFQESPTERLSSEQLLRLADKLDRWRDVGNLFASYLADELSDTPEVLDIVRKAAEIFDDRLNDREEARKYYRRYYDAQPENPEAARLLEEAFERWESWLELRELTDERAGRAVDPGERKALLRRSALLDQEKLDDRGRAIGTLREVLEVDPTDRGAAEELERLLRTEEQWHDLAEHLAFMLERATSARDRDDITFRLGTVLEEKLDDVSGAIDRYADVVAQTPTYGPAIEALERSLDNPDHRYRVAVILDPIYRYNRQWAKLVGAIEAQLESVEDREERVRLLREAAELHQQLGRVDEAFEARSRAWLVDVSSAETLGELEGLAVTTSKYAQLVETLQKGAVEAIDPDLQAQIWGVSARLLEEQLGDQTAAIDAWRSALSARPDDVDAFLSLERLLTAAGRMGELCEILEKHLEISADPEERKGLAKRVAVLYEQALGEIEQAIRAWQTVLDIDPSDVEALDALAKLYEETAAWRELTEIQERKILLGGDAAAVRALRVQTARLYDEKLGEAEEAVQQLRAVLDVHANDREALEMLDALFTREERHADLLEILDMRAALALGPDVDALAFRAARLLEIELSDVEAAIGRYAKILARTPAHAEAREALWNVARGEDYRLSAIAALEPVLRAGAEWDGVLELLELRLAVEDAIPTRLALLAEIARIEEVERKDPRRAFDAWARALTEEATEAAPRQALERLAAASGDWSELARVYEERMDATFDAGLQRSLAVRLAELQETELRDLDRAADFLRKALNLPGDELPVLASLERVLRALGAWSELADILAREAEVAVDPAVQADFLAALGEVRLRELADPDGALASFRDAVERVPAHPAARGALRELLERPDTREGALEVLEPMAEARGDFEDLVALYEHRLTLRDDHAERAHWLRRIAETCETRLNSPGRAIEALGRALAEEPYPGAAVDELERVAALGRMAPLAAGKIEAVLDAAEPDAARELAVRAARLYEPTDPTAAERLYTRVLDADPENVDALTALEAFYRSGADDARLAAILERRAAVELDPDARKRLLGEAAALHERLGDLDAAVADWQTLRSADETDTQPLAELARLFAVQNRTEELCAVLQDWARFTDQPAERAALLARVGELKLGALDDPDGAAEAYREALDSAPEDLAILSALEAVSERREDWSTVQEVLLRRLAATVGPDQIVVLLKLARTAEEKLSDLDQAVGFLHQVLGIDPAHAQAYAELERILRANERWYDLIDVLGKHAEMQAAAGNKPAELGLRVAIAEVWEKDLQSPESAAEALEKVLEVAPTHVPALLSVARLYEVSERWDDAAAALERAAGAVSSGREAAEIHYRNAQIQRARGAAPGDVEALLLRALDADATHRPTLVELESSARAASDPERLVQLLELRVEAAADDEERRAVLAEVAGLYAGPLGRPGAAIPHLERLAALAPDDVSARDQLADALLAEDRADEAATVIRGIIEQLSKARRTKELARYHQKLGAIAAAKGDMKAAAESLVSAYKLDPGHPATLAALGRLSLQQGDHDNARKYYRSLLLQNFDEATTGVSKAEVYLALGQIHLAAKEYPKARNMFERGLEADPANEQLKRALSTVPR